MKTRKTLAHILLHAALIAGSVLFFIPFFWLISTSFKSESEMFLDPPRWLPRIPAASPVSPYIEEREYDELEPPPYLDREQWEALEPAVRAALSELADTFAADLPDPVSPGDVRAEMVQGLWRVLSEQMPIHAWQQPPDAVAADLVALAEPEELLLVYDNLIRKFLLGAVRLRSWSPPEDAVVAEPEAAARVWKSLDPRCAAVVPARDAVRAAGRVDYDLRAADTATLRGEFPSPFPLDNLKRIVIGHRADQTWFPVTFIVEMEGRRFENADPHFLGQNSWQEVTLQFPSPGGKEVQRQTWIELEETSVPGVAYYDAPGRVRVDLAIRRANAWTASFSKFQHNYRVSLNLIPLLLYTKNSVLLVILNVVGQLVGCSLVAFAFARLQWPGRDFCFLLLLATLMLPPQVTMIPVFLIFAKLGWYNTLLPLWIPGFFGSAFFVFLLRQFMKSIPRDLEESARIDGCGYFRIYSQIIMPLMKPALAAVAILTFMAVWNDFMGPLIYVTDQRLYPLSLGLFAIKVIAGGQMGIMMASSLLMTLPVILVFFLAQRHFIQGITLTGMKG